MNKKYYSLNTIKKEQARIQKRACRSSLFGQKITVPTRSGSMNAFMYNDANAHPGYLIVEVHGGGFMYNTAADDDDFCHTIHSILKIPVISCDYRLSPDFPFPIGLEDVYDCIKYALTLSDLKASPEKIILWGHSAGANLAAGAAYLSTCTNDFTPCIQILDYPYMDPWHTSSQRNRIRCSVSGKLMDTFAHYYTADVSTLKNILISPILSQPEAFSRMPKTFILLCGRDNLNEGGKQYGLLLRQAGVPVKFYYVKDALHGFIENHFNYSHIPFLTKLQFTKKQHILAEKSVKYICKFVIKETTI